MTRQKVSEKEKQVGKWLKTYSSVLFLGLMSSCADTGCMDQYNPRPFWNQLEEEEKIANRPKAKLTKDGKLPEQKK